MKKVSIVLAALATIAVALPGIASAQEIGVRIGGDRDFHRDRGEFRERGAYRGARAEYRVREDRGWHRGWDRDQGCAVAVKIFDPGGVADPGRGGLWELDVLTGLRHPGLVHVRDCGVDTQGRPFVVMDLVSGGTLGSRLREGPLPAHAVTRLGAQIAAALAHVHACGVVHRDVKPGNVILSPAGTKYRP